MENPMSTLIQAILQRRAVKVFEPTEISRDLREQILAAARFAPSSFNMQPYRFYWIESPEMKKKAARLCMGQKPAETATVLVAAVADIGSWQTTAQAHLEWMRASGANEGEIIKQERKSKLAKWFFMQGWFGSLGVVKWLLLRILHLWKIIGMPPLSRQGLFKWATKSTSLACENLMIAAETLGLNTCPMEGFDDRRLSRFLGLSRRYQEIVMVIAIGKKSMQQAEQPHWRRPMEATVTIL
jgi:nitroreductase